MPSLETFTYFVIILGGFGSVWTYRKLTRSKEKLPEFEYLAFSAIWGVVVFLAYLLYMHIVGKSSFLAGILEQFAFITGPTMFVFGASLGWIAYGIFKFFIPRWRNFQHKVPGWIREPFE